MRTWMLGAILLFALAFAVPAQAQGCAIMTQYGMAPDYDCDGVIDDLDNCPGIPNAEQHDMNRNGRGDVCDLLIEEIVVNPDSHVTQGEIAHLTVRLINNREQFLGDVLVTVTNKELGIDSEQSIAGIPQGEMAVLDFWILVPKCAKVKAYSLSITASAQGGSTETQTEQLSVERGGVCGTASGPLDTTVIQTAHELDIDAGSATILPISIHNLGDKQATYELSIGELGPFATWRIDPAATMTLAPGHSDTAYLYLQTDSRLPAGRRTVEFTVTSDEQTTAVPISIYVRQYEEDGTIPGILLMQTIFIILLIILIIAAIIVAVRSGRRRPDHEHDRYVHVDDLKKDDDGAAAKAKPTRTTKTTKVTKTTKTVSIEDAEGNRMETYY